MRRRSPVLVIAAVAAALLAGGVAYDQFGRAPAAPGEALGRLPVLLSASDSEPPTIDAYRGLGTWVDAFDFDPAYQGEGVDPAVAPSDVDAMADAGVKTLFLQAARLDDRSPKGLTDPGLQADLLVRAHQRGMRVVAWYLPKFTSVDDDLSRLQQILDFEVFGHRFDGIGLDIEPTSEVTDHAARSAALVALSKQLDDISGDMPVGAIVLPAVQLEVVNTTLWPEIPWRKIEPHFDVWLPMAYWTFRSTDSGYHDGYTYAEESARRLRRNLGDPDARMHLIGGIGDLATDDELEAFARAVDDTAALGGSIYDWSTLDDPKRERLDRLLGGD